MNETIDLKSNKTEQHLIYFLLGGLVMIFTVSTAIFIYLDRRAQKTQYQPASSRTTENVSTEKKLGEYVDSGVGNTSQSSENESSSQVGNGQTDGSVRISEEPQVATGQDTAQNIYESEAELVQDKEQIGVAMRTGLLGVTSQNIEGKVYRISKDRKQILENNSELLRVSSGKIEKFVKVPWLDKVFVVIKLSNKSYALKEYTLLGATPVDRLMYRYEGVYRMVNFYIPSDYIEETNSPRLFFVFYVYETPNQTRFMVQRVKGFAVSKYIIQKYAGSFGGVQEVSYNKDKETIEVKVLIGNRVIEETYFD